MDRELELERRLQGLIDDYLRGNRAAALLKADLDRAGTGFAPVIDHLTIRTHDIDRRAAEFLAAGYEFVERLDYDDWFAKVYRRPGFPPLFIDQAFPGERGRGSIIPEWVERFGDDTLHHVAVLVEDIEAAMRRLREQGVAFAGGVIGERGGKLRQIFTAPEQREGVPFSVLELTERHGGYLGFSPPQADALMRSTVN
jgi:catechol 2,3-dioxygenase-like lactoylglutathione lyase family enzyme